MVRFPAPLRTVREEPEFAAGLRAIFRGVVPNPQLLDEMLNGVVFALARDPRIGARIMSIHICAIPVDMPPSSKSRSSSTTSSTWTACSCAAPRSAVRRLPSHRP